MSSNVRNYYEVNVELGSTFVHIRRDGSIVFNGAVSQDEMSFIALVSDCIRQLKDGISLKYGFDPTFMFNPDEDVHCRWTDRGYLIVSSEKPARRFRHAESPIDALKRIGRFTTSRSIAYTLPRHRTPELVAAMRLQYDDSRSKAEPDTGEEIGDIATDKDGGDVQA